MDPYICYACGDYITDGGLLFPELGNRAYHNWCLACPACRGPITGAYRIHEHQLYHPECLDSVLAGRWCAACGELVLGEFIRMEDRYWHPAEFNCRICGLSLATGQVSIVMQSGQPYCEACFQALPRCSICLLPLTDGHYENHWGDRYCHTHQYEYYECSCCRRLICPPLTGGGAHYLDGRWVCNPCRETAIDTLDFALPAFEQVWSTLAGWGMGFTETAIPLELIDQRAFRSQSSMLGIGDRYGITSRFTRYEGATHVGGGVERISILNGLPRELFTAAAAHELGHAYLCINNITPLNSEIEEGFCELLAYLWLRSLDTPSSTAWIQNMVDNENQTYSNGLRLAIGSYLTHSFPAVLSHLQTYGRLP